MPVGTTRQWTQRAQVTRAGQKREPGDLRDAPAPHKQVGKAFQVAPGWNVLCV